MSGIALFTVTGWKARILNLITGTLTILIGALLSSAGLGDPTAPLNILFIVIGAVFGFFGLKKYYSAVRGGDFEFKLKGSTTAGG